MEEQKGFVRDLTRGSITKNLYALALPMILGLMAETAMGLIDMFYVGKISPQAIAAVSMARMVSWVLMIFVEGVCIATTAMVSRFYGAGEKKMANRVANQALITDSGIASNGGITDGYLDIHVLWIEREL